MLLYFCISLVLINTVDSSQVSHNSRKDVAPKQTETIFANVIKNISRVNNVLQELISNYEHLQKIYKSQENVESGISDSEIDEVFKNKKKERANINAKTTKQPLKEQFAATQMFWSEDDDNDDDNDNSDVSESKESNKVNDADSVSVKHTDHSASIEPAEYSPVKTKETTTKKPVRSSKISDSSSTSISEEKPQKVHQIILKKVLKANKAESPNIAKPDKPTSELIFIDTHKKLNEKYKNQKAVVSTKVENPLESKVEKLKTRYIKVNNSLTDIYVKPNAMSEFNNTRTVKKIIRSEAFSPKKIWNDIINNKPIYLEAHNEKNNNWLRRRTKQENQLNVKNKSGKTALVIVTKNKQYQEEAESSDSDSTLKEENEERALRKAYGDACLKVVIRRCYKANKKVSKTVCGRTKCKSAQKNAFKSFSKTACLNEFHGSGGGDSQTAIQVPVKHRNKKKKRVHAISSDTSDTDMINHRVKETEYTTDTGFTDMTREGYLSAACFPYQNGDPKKLSLRNETQTTEAGNFNILRDRFEKTCQKISTTKCRNACKFSYTKMCEQHQCSKRMKKLYKKSCKAECKKFFKVTKDSSSSEDSDSYDEKEETDESERSETESD